MSDLDIIYVVSNPIKANNNIYRIGKYSGSSKKLIKRYTSNFLIYFSYHVPKDKSSKIAKEVHDKLNKYRLVDGNTTKWFRVKITKIIRTIFSILQYHEKSSIEDNVTEREIKDNSTAEPGHLTRFVDECLNKKEDDSILSTDLFETYIECCKYNGVSSG